MLPTHYGKLLLVLLMYKHIIYIRNSSQKCTKLLNLYFLSSLKAATGNLGKYQFYEQIYEFKTQNELNVPWKITLLNSQ